MCQAGPLRIFRELAYCFLISLILHVMLLFPDVGSCYSFCFCKWLLLFVLLDSFRGWEYVAPVQAQRHYYLNISSCASIAYSETA